MTQLHILIFGRLLTLILILMVPLAAPAIIRHDIADDMEKAEKFVNSGDFDKADEIYRNLLDQYKAGNDDAALARALKWGGNVCVRTGRPIDALEFYLSALKIAKKHNDTPNIETTLVNIGIVYALFKDYEQAISYFEKALPIARANNDKYTMAICYINLSGAYSELGMTAEAEENLRLQRKYPLPDSVDNKFYISHNTGLIKRAAEHPEKAIKWQQDALDAIHGIEGKEYLNTAAYIEIAKAYGKLEKPDSAYSYLIKSLDCALQKKAPEYLQTIYDELSRHFRILGETDSVYKYQLLYYEVSDSQFNNNRFNNIKGKLNVFEKDETNRHIGHLKETIGTLSLCLALIALISIILIIYYRKIRKAKQLLVKKNQELFRQIETTNAIIGSYASKQATNHATQENEDSSQEENYNNLELVTKIQQTMENLDIISNPDFSLPQLAALVESNTSYVSAVINDTFGKNFKTYLNEYRIHEACRRLTNPQYSKLTMAAIAQEVGFKTQNSFIINFKKVTGLTPSVYRGISRDLQPHPTNANN